ncbi:MAG: 3-oxoacyl-[acyl-carrier-protein] synthase [Chloroflexia bacterium]|nr:3-oxoacyl-[acyl-carrier-protein] synthase [Chloroflexia bacterium]
MAAVNSGLKRVVITGIGAITPLGHGRQGLWQGVLAGKSAVKRLDRFDPAPFRSQVAAQIDDFDPLDHLDAQRARRLDRYSQFALAAAQQAVLDSGLCLSSSDAEHTGVYLGSALGGLAFAEEQHDAFVKHGLRAVNNILALTVFGSASSCNVAMEMGFNGPNQTNANSCASGAVAIGEAFNLVRLGRARIMLAGGVESPLAPLTFGAFDLIRAISSNSNDTPSTASRPFDAHRDGFVMSEGSAVLVLEEYEHARARGATIYAELLGYATTTDAYHMTAPRPDGAQAIRAMQEALDDAHLQPGEIDYISAHGSATPLNDKTETRSIKQVFGERAYSIPISGTKSLHGHALGASGAFELAITCLAMTHDYLPPTVNLQHPDPECDLDYLPNAGRSGRVNAVLSNSFGFGGINACLVLGRL